MHWAGFPTQIAVYNCNANLSALTTAVNQWNSNGPYGTIFNLQPGTNCSPSSGIVVQSSPATGPVGYFAMGNVTNRPHEMLKDATQPGRVFRPGWVGEQKLITASVNVNVNYLTDPTVYAHELGHATGLFEHYGDMPSTTGCYFWTSVMTCSGITSSPQTHDDSDGSGRFYDYPWGPGAIWLTNVTDSSVVVNWADINDEESGYRVYKNGTLMTSLGADAESATIASTSSTDCFYVRAVQLSVTSQSSTICRNSVIGTPTGPTSVSAVQGSTTYSAKVSWNSTDPTYTFEWVAIYTGGAHVASFYVPYHGTGATTRTFNLIDEDFGGTSTSVTKSFTVEVSACNQTHNPWVYPYCHLGGSASVSLTS